MNGYDPRMLTMAYSIHADRLAQAATSLRRAQGPATAASDTVRGIARCGLTRPGGSLPSRGRSHHPCTGRENGREIGRLVRRHSHQAR